MKATKKVTATPEVLETGDLYVVISNISKNPAYDVNMTCKFSLQDGKVLQYTQHIDYLNPVEATREPLQLRELLNKYPELFLEKTVGNTTKKIPKKSLQIFLDITLTYNSPKYMIKDSYEIHFESLESIPDFENHPSISCWNRRNGIYIYKHQELA